MKLVELLYQNRDKFTLHDDCRWIAQDYDFGGIFQYTDEPKIAGAMVFKSDFHIRGVECCSGKKIAEDWQTPLSRSDYEKYCKEQDEKLLSDIDNALIRHDAIGMTAEEMNKGVYRVGEKIKSDGSTASYYELPGDSKELQDLISHRNMNAQIGEIFRACYRYGLVSHSDMLRDAKKIKFYADAEIKRLEKELANNG